MIGIHIHARCPVYGQSRDEDEGRRKTTSSGKKDLAETTNGSSVSGFTAHVCMYERESARSSPPMRRRIFDETTDGFTLW